MKFDGYPSLFFKTTAYNGFFSLVVLRGCSYGGELVQLGGLARLGEISISLRNSYKNIMCTYEK